MKHVLCLVGVCGLFVACGADATRGAAPSTKPATQPVVTDKLVDGAVQFARPADWTEAKGRTALAVGFVSPDRKGMITVEVWPDGQLGSSTGAQVVKRLREARKKQANLQIVMEPKIEQDKRFQIRVREQYKSGEGTYDVLRLYRQVGPRVVMVMVNSSSPEDARDKEIHQAGEEVAVSATFAKPAKK
jgi:hypothetical protein